jgi:hypothetical protein
MKRGIVEVVRVRNNLSEMLPCYSVYPRVAYNILWVIDPEKAETKIARIKRGRSNNA